jgi:transposase
VQKEHLAVKAGDRTATKPAPKRTIGNLPAALPRIEEVIEPDSLICPCGCGVAIVARTNGATIATAQDRRRSRAERLDIVPAQLRVIVTIRPKYACRICTDGVTQGEPLCAIGSRTMASAPSHLIMGGLPTEGAIAHVPPLAV